MTTIHKEHHLILQQNEKEKAILQDFYKNKDSYTLDHPKVVVNPYGIAPLTALLLFTTERKTEITVTVKGKETRGDVTHTFPAETDHILPIYGLYLGQENKVVLSAANGGESEILITTEADNSEHISKMTKVEEKEEYLGNSWILMTPTSKHYPAAYDHKGDLRWYVNIFLSFDAKRLKNGHFLVGTHRLVQKPYYVTGLFEMALSGKIYREYRVPGGYHHDTAELRSGDLLFLSQGENAETVEDTLVQVRREDGAVIREWDFKDMFVKPYSGSGTFSDEDWCHSNGVYIDEDRDEVFISGRHIDAVFCFSYVTGKLKFVLSDPEGWDPDFVDEYFLKAEGDDFEWFYEQHGITPAYDGNIFLFDNGHYRSKNKEKYISNADNYSRGVLYEIDREKMTVKQVFQYGKERGADYFSPYICNVEYYEKDRYMVHSGGIAYKDGKPLEGLGSFEANGPEGDRVTLLSVTTELYKNEVMFELQLDSNMFRAEKIQPYFSSEVFVEEEGKILGRLGETATMDVELPVSSKEIGIPEHYHAELTEEYDRYRLNAVFEKGELIMLVLKQGDEERRYFVSTAQSDTGAMCVGTFLQKDPRNVEFFIHKQGLQGTYRLFFIADGVEYDSKWDLSF